MTSREAIASQNSDSKATKERNKRFDPHKKNYRSISLLSIHYKLANCAITKRIKPHMTGLINRQQKAFVDNNDIGSCILEIFPSEANFIG